MPRGSNSVFIFRLAGTCLLVSSLWASSPKAFVFTFFEIPSHEPSGFFWPLGVNPQGDVVGFYINEDGYRAGFLYTDGQVIDICNPDPNAGWIHCTGEGINAQGDIVGAYCLEPSGYPRHGFRLRHGEYETYDFPSTPHSVATGINAKGDIVGVYSVGEVGHHDRFSACWLYSQGRFTSYRYPTDPPLTSCPSLNNRGQIIGRYQTSGPAWRNVGFLLQDGVFTEITCRDGTEVTEVRDINSPGEMVGRCSKTDPLTNQLEWSGACLIHDGDCTEIKVPGARRTSAEVISEPGLIVGTYLGPDDRFHGFFAQRR